MEVLVAGFSVAATSEAQGVCVVKVIVPGLEVETLSYGRIGARNVARLMKIAAQRGPVLAGVGDAPEGALPVALREAAPQKMKGAAWFDARVAGAVVGRHAVALWDETRALP